MKGTVKRLVSDTGASFQDLREGQAVTFDSGQGPLSSAFFTSTHRTVEPVLDSLCAVPPQSIDTRFEQALERAEDFFMQKGRVHQAAVAIAQRLDAAGVPYAIAEAMAMGAYGYERVTTDVDVLLSREGLEQFKRAHLGRGYAEKFPGSRGVRDTEHGVSIEVLVAGDFPGDGRPKPVCFPDPADVAVEGQRFRILPLDTLIELKLASGISAPHRLKDLADVLELIRAVSLPADVARRLHPYVREKYLELWRAAQGRDPE